MVLVYLLHKVQTPLHPPAVTSANLLGLLNSCCLQAEPSAWRRLSDCPIFPFEQLCFCLCFPFTLAFCHFLLILILPPSIPSLCVIAAHPSVDAVAHQLFFPQRSPTLFVVEMSLVKSISILRALCPLGWSCCPGHANTRVRKLCFPDIISTAPSSWLLPSVCLEYGCSAWSWSHHLATRGMRGMC